MKTSTIYLALSISSLVVVVLGMVVDHTLDTSGALLAFWSCMILHRIEHHAETRGK